MIKKSKKIVALIMSLVMLFPMALPLQAADLDSNQSLSNVVSIDEKTTEVTFMPNGIVNTLRIIERDYGIVFYEYYDGELVRSAVVYHDNRDRGYITSHSERGQSTEVIEFSDFICNAEEPHELTYSSLSPQSNFGISPNSSGPFPPNFSMRGIIEYNAIFSPPVVSGATHEIMLFHDGGRSSIPGQALTFNNAWTDGVQIAVLVANILAISSNTKVGTAVGIILDLFGVRSTTQTFLIAFASFRATRTVHQFGVVGSVRPGVQSPSPATRTFPLISYFLTSTTHNIPTGFHWDDLNIITQSPTPWGHPTFGLRVFQMTFPSQPQIFQILRWR